MKHSKSEDRPDDKCACGWVSMKGDPKSARSSLAQHIARSNKKEEKFAASRERMAEYTAEQEDEAREATIDAGMTDPAELDEMKAAWAEPEQPAELLGADVSAQLVSGAVVTGTVVEVRQNLGEDLLVVEYRHPSRGYTTRGYFDPEWVTA
jgi:hypothetical protein